MSRRIDNSGSAIGKFSLKNDKLFFTTTSNKKYRVVDTYSGIFNLVHLENLLHLNYEVKFHLAPGFNFPWNEKIIVDFIGAVDN